MTSPVVIETSQVPQPVERDTFTETTTVERERLASWPYPRRRPLDA